jgi:hypothetical protein
MDLAELERCSWLLRTAVLNLSVAFLVPKPGTATEGGPWPWQVLLIAIGLLRGDLASFGKEKGGEVVANCSLVGGAEQDATFICNAAMSTSNYHKNGKCVQTTAIVNLQVKSPLSVDMCLRLACQVAMYLSCPFWGLRAQSVTSDIIHIIVK